MKGIQCCFWKISYNRFSLMAKW